jgi:hypothetical protein
MTTRFATTYIGVKDGTVPQQLADGRVVDSKKRRILAPKQVLADAIGDLIFVGTLPIGATMSNFTVNTDTALAGVTLSLGTLANPTAYVNAAAAPANVNIPSAIGPKASAFVQAPLTAEQDLYVLIGGAAMPAAAIVGFAMEYTISA